MQHPVLSTSGLFTYKHLSVIVSCCHEDSQTSLKLYMDCILFYVFLLTKVMFKVGFWDHIRLGVQRTSAQRQSVFVRPLFTFSNNISFTTNEPIVNKFCHKAGFKKIYLFTAEMKFNKKLNQGHFQCVGRVENGP